MHKNTFLKSYHSLSSGEQAYMYVYIGSIVGPIWQSGHYYLRCPKKTMWQDNSKNGVFLHCPNIHKNGLMPLLACSFFICKSSFSQSVYSIIIITSKINIKSLTNNWIWNYIVIFCVGGLFDCLFLCPRMQKNKIKIYFRCFCRKAKQFAKKANSPYQLTQMGLGKCAHKTDFGPIWCKNMDQFCS